MSEQEEVIKGMLSNEQVEALKNQYPGLKSIIFQNYETGEKAVVYIKKITRPVYATALKISETKDRLTLGEYLLKNLRVCGMEEKEIVDEIDWLGNFSAMAETLIWINKGEIKKN